MCYTQGQGIRCLLDWFMQGADRRFFITSRWDNVLILIRSLFFFCVSSCADTNILSFIGCIFMTTFSVSSYFYHVSKQLCSIIFCKIYVADIQIWHCFFMVLIWYSLWLLWSFCHAVASSCHNGVHTTYLFFHSYAYGSFHTTLFFYSVV